MAKKIRDVAVKTGQYQDQHGNTKGRWQNVGALMKGDDGGEFIIMQRWFNPAGVANPENRESVVLSCFPLSDNSQQGQGQGQQQQAPQQPQSQPSPQVPDPADDFDDDIPF